MTEPNRPQKSKKRMAKLRRLANKKRAAQELRRNARQAITEQDAWAPWDSWDAGDSWDDDPDEMDDSPAASWDTAGGPIRQHLVATDSPAFSPLYAARAAIEDA